MSGNFQLGMVPDYYWFACHYALRTLASWRGAIVFRPWLPDSQGVGPCIGCP